ncbi:PH domain-containing protein [Demequina capsici]|uniref:PH domain-containing protein n=1 Tax=Demequina capsici TaxID=3075620 RepID=A0AA96F7E6_9MICO|nr:PH domain-containing protein [Demequina sp. OYTSA14]WNM25461.1 PH domain-containing protein [Demequina sp. OYTSA14]
MAYPRDLLAPDEEIIIDERPHWKALIGAALSSVLVLVLGGLAWWWMASVDWGSGVESGIGIAVAVVLVGLVIWLAVTPYVRWATTHFVVTDRRVIFRTGVLTKSGIDIPLARINSVQFRHGLVDRMFRTGTLIIESASDDPLEFDDIPNVERVHARLYEELNEALEGDDEK